MKKNETRQWNVVLDITIMFAKTLRSHVVVYKLVSNHKYLNLKLNPS